MSDAPRESSPANSSGMPLSAVTPRRAAPAVRGPHAWDWRFAALVVFALTLLLVVVYHQSFRVLPAGDDFSAMAEIQRGNEVGWVKFFTERVEIKNYRPLQNLVTWAMADAFPAHRAPAIKVLNFASMAVMIGVTLLWARALRLTRGAAVIAAIVAAFHPGMAGTINGLDTFSSILAPVLMWLAAWCVYRFRDRLGLALLSSLPVFIIAIGFKEYAFGLAPLGGLIIWWFGGNKALGRAILYGVVTSAVVAANLWVRRYTMPADADVTHVMPPLTLKYIPQNLVIFAAGVMVPINSAWVYLTRTPVALGLAGGTALLCGAWLLAGLWPYLQGRMPPGGAVAGSPAAALPREYSSRWWAGFLVVSVLPASFPSHVLPDVSEIYLAGLVIPAALLAGLAWEGFTLWSAEYPRRKLAAGAAAILWLAAAVVTDVLKTARVVDTGERADRMLRQVLAVAPADKVGARVALLFPEPLTVRKTYSVFAMSDDVPLVNPKATDWLAPERQVRTQRFFGAAAQEFAAQGFDAVLVWDQHADTFRPR